MITSTTNPRIKSIAKLDRRRNRDETGKFPIEGARMVRRAHEAGWPIVEVYVAPDLVSADAFETARILDAADVRIIDVGEAVFRKISYRSHPDGILAVGRTVPSSLEDLSLPSDAFVLVVEAIEKPGNLGAMLRTADGAGVDAVIAAGQATDRYNPNVVRAAQGSLFSVPFALGEPGRVRDWLAAREITTFAASPDGTAAPWEVDLTGSVALVVGSEHAGLTGAWDGTSMVAIPMEGSADSLNASSAAAILLFEAVRQRRTRPASDREH